MLKYTKIDGSGAEAGFGFLREVYRVYVFILAGLFVSTIILSTYICFQLYHVLP